MSPLKFGMGDNRMNRDKIFNHAQWIWGYTEEDVNLYMDFFTDFDLIEADNCKLYICACSQYAIYINGVFVNSGQFPDYAEYQVYDCLDIDEYIVPGRNQLKITGYAIGEDCATYRKETPGLIFSVWRGDVCIKNSDSACQFIQNPCYYSGEMEKVTGQISFSFRYDATAEKNVLLLRPSEILNKSKQLYPRPVEKVLIKKDTSAVIQSQGVFVKGNTQTEDMGEHMQTAFLSYRDFNVLCKNPDKTPCSLPKEAGYCIEATDQDNCDGIYLVLDLKQETVGFISFDIELAEECNIHIGYGEHLDDLRVRSYVLGHNFCASYKGKKGRNTFFSPFKRIGLRYLQLHIFSKTCTLYYAGVKPTEYPVAISDFHCLDSLHNRIYEICCHTLEMCMHDHYEDCPWREQSLYSMDSRNQMLCGYYTFGEYSFPKASLRVMAKSIREDGTLELCAPGRLCLTIPSFTMIFIVQLYEYLLYSGDLDFIKEVFPVATQIMNSLVKRIHSDTGLIATYQGVEYWNFYEWREGSNGIVSQYNTNLQEEVFESALNAFLSMAVRAYTSLCTALGEDKKAKKFTALHKGINEAMHRFFWNDEKQAYISRKSLQKDCVQQYTELSQALMIYADACPGDCLDTVLHKLSQNEFEPISLSMSIFKYEALMKQSNTYAQYVWDDISKIWGTMVFQNATTFWETEDGAWDFSNSASLCHAWSATPAYLYFAYGLGIRPTSLGFKTYDVKPKFPEKYVCTGSFFTPCGKITIE